MIPYCGYSQKVSLYDTQRVKTSQSLNEILVTITKHTNNMGTKDGDDWNRLLETLKNVNDIVHIEPNDTDNGSTESARNILRHHQLIILNDTIIPYVSKMTTRMVLEKKRFRQIVDLLAIVFHEANINIVPGGVQYNYTTASPTQHQHPSFMLNHMDGLIREINAEGGFWKSEFSTLLTNTSNVLWRPILVDMKVSLTSISSKLVIIGLVDMIGKPLLMLYPVWMLCQQILVIVQNIKLERLRRRQVDTRSSPASFEEFLALRGLNLHIIFQMVKAIVLLVIISNLIKILEMFHGIGAICLLLGTGLYALSLNEGLFKKYIPIIAPNIMFLHSMMDQVLQLESMIECNVIGSATTSSNTSGSPNSAGNSMSGANADENPNIVSATAFNTHTPVAVPVSSTSTSNSTNVVDPISVMLPSERIVDAGFEVVDRVMDHIHDMEGDDAPISMAAAHVTQPDSDNTAQLRRRRK